jgi:nucleoside-diphosphate-sugar epimerase
VVRSLLAGERARCTHGGQIRVLLAVDDAARAFCDLLLSDVTGPVNIASGDAVSIRDVVLAAARQLGAEGRVDFGTIEANGDEPPVLVADTRRLRDEVGWRPRRDLQSGLAASIAWWRAQER